MKRLLLSALTCAVFCMSVPAHAETYRGWHDISGGLNIEIDGIAFMEEISVEDSRILYGSDYPIFKSAENESNFLGGFMMGVGHHKRYYGETSPGKTIKVRANFRSQEENPWVVIMLTPVKMGKKGKEDYVQAIENKIVFKEINGLSMEASLPFDDSMRGVIVSVRARDDEDHGTVTIYIVSDQKKTITSTTEAGGNTGEELTPPAKSDDTTIPWEVVIPGAVIGGWGVHQIRKRNKNKGGKNKSKPEKETKKKKEEKPSTYRMILWKSCGDTLYFGEPPVQVGARIVEVKDDGTVVQRPDLTSTIHISGKANALVEKVRTEGKYRMADLTPMSTMDKQVPETATVSFIFEGEQARFVRNLVFKVEGEAAILVAPTISFAAGQGKTLEMGFALLGGLKSPDKINIKLSDGAQEHFRARLEQSAEDADIFNIHLTEMGKADQIAGTVEEYTCTIEAWPRGKAQPVKETFDICRIHPGLRLQIRALKSYLVEIGSTPDNDIMPVKGSKRRLQYAQSRVDWQLVVIDEQQDGQVRSVFPDEKPVFTYEDDYEGSMLFTERDKSNYVPEHGDLVTYDGTFYRDYNGETIPSLVQSLAFEYKTAGRMPDGGYWGVISAAQGYLAPPNRSHVKVKVSMVWRGTTYTQEVRVPLNSQPIRDQIPEGMDVMRGLARWDNLDLDRKNKLMDIQRNICLDSRFMELRPMFYKVTVMLEGYNSAFGYDDADYENVMDIYRRFSIGEIGTAFANKSTFSPDTEDLDAAMATIASMEKSVPVIIMRIGLGIVTGGASEVAFAPISALSEMKEYVDKGGDSAFEAFQQSSWNIVKMELGFAIGGKVVGKSWAKIKQFRADKAARSKAVAGQVEKLTVATKKAAESTRVSEGLSSAAKNFNSAKTAEKISKAASKAKKVLKSSNELADDAIRQVRNNPSLYTSESKLAEEAAKAARKDGQKLLDEFKRVMNNPTATKEEMRKATLALQGNKTAQNLLRNQPSDMLRANFNAQMQSMYDDIDVVVVKRLRNKISDAYPTYKNKPPEVRVFKGATGNAGDELRLGRKIGADRDVTYQFKGHDGKWYDLNENLMGDTYAEVFNEMQYKFVPKDHAELMKTLKKADQAVVNGRLGLESYGDDLGRIIDPARQAEKLGDPERIAKTYIHKCKEWMDQGKEAHKQAHMLFESGMKEDALRVLGYGDALIEEGVRQNVKQFKRILVPRIEAAAAKGAKLDYTKLMAKIRVLDSIASPPPKGAIPISLEEARLVLKNQFGTTLEAVVEECGQAVLDVNKVL
ncbi:MAG: hypothetical protein IJV37_04890 [Bacteroidales bacterium]|nr:hypothetical protein [Bacteroidales bacterium]